MATNIRDRQYKTAETPKKEVFSSGAQRNDPAGKGKYVLVTPLALRRLAGVYERGANVHGVRNWEKGLHLSRFLDSAIRHIYQHIEGDRSEDHLAQAAWNIFGAIHTEEMVERGLLPEDLNDLPNYLTPVEKSTRPCCGDGCQCAAEKKDDPRTAPRPLSDYAGADVFVDNRIGRIAQVTHMTPPEQGIIADVAVARHEARGGGATVRERWGWGFKDRQALEQAIEAARRLACQDTRNT